MPPRRLVLALLALPSAARSQPEPTLPEPPGLLPWPAEPRLAFQPGAEALAAATAPLLPGALAQVEAYHGFGFARPVLVRAFAEQAAFELHSGVRAGPLGVTIQHAVHLAPALAGAQRRALPRLLVHELAHLLLFQRLPALALASLPPWFLEGVAVDCSGGDGGVRTTPAQAMAALRQGRHFQPQPAVLPFMQHQGASAFGLTTGEFYRQAALFCAWLRQGNPAGWQALLAQLAGGAGLAEAFARALGTTLAAAFAAWRG